MNLQFCNKYLIVFTIEHCFSDCHCINLNKEIYLFLKKRIFRYSLIITFKLSAYVI